MNPYLNNRLNTIYCPNCGDKSFIKIVSAGEIYENFTKIDHTYHGYYNYTLHQNPPYIRILIHNFKWVRGPRPPIKSAKKQGSNIASTTSTTSTTSTSTIPYEYFFECQLCKKIIHSNILNTLILKLKYGDKLKTKKEKRWIF